MTSPYGKTGRRAALLRMKKVLLKQIEAITLFVEPPPEPDPAWSDEMKEAHRALHRGPPLVVKFRRYGG